MRIASSRNVTTIRKRPIAGKYLHAIIISGGFSRRMVGAQSDCKTARSQSTYGLSGSAIVSIQSSILLVCARIASKGLGSAVASGLLGPPKGLLGPPKEL